MIKRTQHQEKNCRTIRGRLALSIVCVIVIMGACSSDVKLGDRDLGPGMDGSSTWDTFTTDTVSHPDRFIVDGPVADGPVADASCPPVPSCNWCGGTETKDAKGCVIGFTCANGVDPCVTQPCSGSSDCQPNETCGTDQLCWPKSDAGVICPPIAPCNWCGGTSIKDANGCVIGFKCANGVDPCVTQPCMGSSDCKPNETCGTDMLCWPKAKDAGVGFSCGAVLTCTSGEYCEQIEPSYCVGNPVPDGGTCPPNCSAKICTPGGSPVCVCDSYTCRKLPVGCTSCSCITTRPPGPCTCTAGPGGAINVRCGPP